MTEPAEKTEEQIAKDRAAVDAMRNAKSNMDTALARISDLERAVAAGIDHIRRFKAYVPTGAYPYKSDTHCHRAMDEAIADLTKRLG